MKILIDDSVYTPSAYVVVRGVRGVERFHLVEVGSAGVVAVEADVGEGVFISGSAEQVFVRSGGSDVVLSGDFVEVEIWARDAYLMDVRVSSGKFQRLRSLVVQNSTLSRAEVSSEHMDFLILYSSDIEGSLFKLNSVVYALWAGTRKRPLRLYGGRLHLGSVERWWIAGTQVWDGGVIVDVGDVGSLVVTGRVDLGSVSIPEDVEWAVSRKDYQKELAEIVEIKRGGDEDGAEG